MPKKVLIIGLDCAAPELVFEKFLDDLPNIKKMLTHGVYGKLKSCIPPITIPAWMVMMTSRDPGTLGLYGFRHKKSYSYETWIANSKSIKHKTIWDILSEKGLKSCIVGVPPSYPPKPINGCLVSCFITPDAEKDYTYPKELKSELEAKFGKYIFDVEFRAEERDQVLERIYEMTKQHFQVIKYLIQKGGWDLFAFVEIGLDRIHHAFWKFFDKKHPKYVPNNKYENVIREYYKYLDKEIGDLLGLLDNDTIVLVVSDHGAKQMKGAFCINQWLMQEGYLKIKGNPERGAKIEDAPIDWARTKAWGWGGYYARIFINVEGREPQGTVTPEDYEKTLDELAEKLKQIRGPNGEKFHNKIYKPEEIYDELNGDSPDLIVYFDDLYWRSAGTIGYETLYLSENDTGPDDAVHSEYGVFILYDPTKNLGLELGNLNILDVAPTVLNILGLPVPKEMRGKIISW
ncbi:MAG: alkaline phosphatase family protein [Candidatus Jordarchaeaceae archaeon]